MIAFTPNFWPLSETFDLARIIMAFAQAWWTKDV
jgi:hypothetical protein